MMNSRISDNFATKLAGLVLSLLLMSAPATAQSLFPEVQPNPAYTPDEVVGIQMRALANNSSPFEGAGVELTFRFASPDNKAVTGPLEKFRTLFDNPAYGPMIDHATLEIGEGVIGDYQAMVPVIITTTDGTRAGYMFSLSRQGEGQYENCWMTDRVVRIRLPAASGEVL